jgi:hypothetical protein
MIEITKIKTYGWEEAIRGMRNSYNSWDKSDSKFDMLGDGLIVIGPNDLALMKKLCAAGTDHCKFMRMITVSMDINAPLYWWKEFDTYKVGTVANSCSTMHKIAEKEFTLDDFSCEHLDHLSLELMNNIIAKLNANRNEYLEYKDGDDSINSKKDYWWQIIQLLPSSYNQRRTVMLNYEVLANIYKSRKNHKLDEWQTFCKMMESTLPYPELFTTRK